MAVFRQHVLKYIIDHPGIVIYRSEMEEKLNLDSRQVSMAVLNIQKTTPVGKDVETLIRGNAWRYLPNQRNVGAAVAPTPRAAAASTNGATPSTNYDLPLTTLVRRCFIENAHAVITVDDLASYTGEPAHKVKVAVNNMRRIIANGDVTPFLTTEIRGQAWRFAPPASWRPYGERPTSTSTSSTERVIDTTTLTTGPKITRTPGVRTFAEVGTAGDAIIIRCDDDGTMYRAVPLA